MTNSIPQHGVLMLQPRCNMTCSFCVTEDTMGTMSFELAQATLQDFKSRNFTSAIFGGGEPFFWPHDLRKILQFAKSLGLKTQVGTNAIKLPEDLASWDFVDRWVIPIDGVSQETHNQLRSFQNRHWQIIDKALARLRQQELSTTISTVITKVNRHEVLALAEYLARLQNDRRDFLHAWHLYKFLPFGRGGKSHKSELEVEDEIYEDLVHRVKQLSLPFQVFKRKDMLLSKTVEFYWAERGQLMVQSRALGTRVHELSGLNFSWETD